MPLSFWNRLGQERFAPQLGTYHVTTLTNCLAKAYFERTSPIEETVQSAWAKLRGSLIHYVTRSLGWSELRTKMTFDLQGEVITVVGYVDAYDPETATIYDLKTTRFVSWQADKGFIPRANHITQVQCYYTMLDIYGIPVNRLVLIYVDDKDIITKQVPLGNRRQWMIERASMLHMALTYSKLPKPEVGSGCKYCYFLENCPRKSDALKFKEAMR
jgi:CRISPR/Cas system-associated exonuclease Cas4 (RecB family)